MGHSVFIPDYTDISHIEISSHADFGGCHEGSIKIAIVQKEHKHER